MMHKNVQDKEKKEKEQSERLARECELPFAPDRFSSPIMAPASVFSANFAALVSIAHAL